MTIPVDVPIRSALRSRVDGVAVVMPAYCEEENLARTVSDFLSTLESAGVRHTVVVTNDGSRDRTGEILDVLVRDYPGRVIAVHHSVNQGYGAAVRSGIRAALERTEFQWILLTDSDGQFHADDAVTFLDVRRSERADAVIGYRAERADPTMRKVNAWIWTRMSRLLLGVRSRDVDCAFKLIDRSLLDDVDLTGEAAAISPEVLAKISSGRPRVVEHPVGHYPREHGEQTGARLSVIARSVLSLVTIRMQLTRRWLDRTLWWDDPTAAWMTVAAAVISVVSYLYFVNQGLTLAYKDADSHLLIARRVLDSPTAGMAQLGGVWLPLPHLLAIPLVWNDDLFHSGFAGAIVSMVAFVVAVRYLYKLGVALVGGRFGGLTTALVFAANPNVLYLQSTAMTEMLLFACVAAAIYYLHEWCHRAHYRDLARTSLAVLLATLTRYEGWVLCLAGLAVVIYTELKRHRQYVRTESSLIFYGLVAVGGIAGWLLWNELIFKNPFYWHNGEYADSSLWVAINEAAVGHVDVAVRTYWFAMAHNLGIPIIVLGTFGMLAFLVRTRLRAESVAVFPLLAFAAFFVYALYTGQRPLHVAEINGELYNIRFGLISLLPAAVFTGYLVSLAVPAVRGLGQWITQLGCGTVRLGRRIERPARADDGVSLGPLTRRLGRQMLVLGRRIASGRRRPVAIARGIVCVLAVSATLGVSGVVTLDEARDYEKSQWANAAVSQWLRTHYDGRPTLMMSYSNESVMFDSHVDTAVTVYEGSYRLWDAALADPAGQNIDWIYMRAEPGSQDAVWKALYGTPALTDSYDLVYDQAYRLVYHRKVPR